MCCDSVWGNVQTGGRPEVLPFEFYMEGHRLWEAIPVPNSSDSTPKPRVELKSLVPHQGLFLHLAQSLAEVRLLARLFGNVF